MNSRIVGLLVVVAAAAGVGAWMAGRAGSGAPATAGLDQPLLPAVAERVNDAAALSIVTGAERFTLRREGDGWKVVERDGYPAKFATIKKTLIALSQMKTLEAKTNTPALHAKIGLEDPEQPDSSSALLTVLDAEGKALGAVILGRNGPAPDTMFARRASEAQCWLVKPDLYLDRSVKQWLDTDLWKLPATRVKAATTVHGDGERVAVGKALEGDTDWLLQDVPEGSQPKSASVGRILAAALESLTFENVAAVAGKPLPETERVVTTLDTFDGLHVVVTTAREPGPEPEPAEDNGEGEDAPPAPTSVWWAQIEVSATPEAGEPVKEEAAKAAAKLSPWIFALPEYRATSLRKRMADMTQPIAVPNPDAEPAPMDGAVPAEDGAESHEGHDHGDDATAPPVPLIDPPLAPPAQGEEPPKDGAQR